VRAGSIFSAVRIWGGLKKKAWYDCDDREPGSPVRSLARVELGRELFGVVSGKPCPLFFHTQTQSKGDSNEVPS
jgi:hypothetical protein